MKNIQLTDNLFLTEIDDNVRKRGKVTTVYLGFTFFGQNAEAYLLVNSLKEDYPSYVMIEASSELHDSFINLIEENEDVMEKIKKAVNEFVAEWEEEYGEYEY